MFGLSMILIASLWADDLQTGWAAVWAPYPDQLVVAPEGRSYVVLKRIGGPVFKSPFGKLVAYFVQSAPDRAQPIAGSAPVKIKLDNSGHIFTWQKSPGIDVRAGDAVLCSETLEQPPGEILVSRHGWGCVFLDQYGPNVIGNNPINCSGLRSIVVEKGKITRSSKTLVDLFGFDGARSIVERRDVLKAEGHIHWLRGAWLEETAGCVVVVAYPARMCRVDCSTGLVSMVDTKAAWSEVENPNVSSNLVAIELLCEDVDPRRSDDIRKALQRKGRSRGEKARLLLVLSFAGDTVAKKELSELLLDGEYQSEFSYSYVLARLDQVLGSDAIPICFNYLATEERLAAAEVLERLDAEAYRYAVKLLKSKNSKDRLMAVEGLLVFSKGKFGKDAVAHLRDIQNDPDEEVSTLAKFWVPRLSYPKEEKGDK